jgi:leader peptidase (prepilin peptidase)/N-methyltransferase
MASLAVAGGLAGSALPSMIAKIPDRPAPDDEPAPTPYRELARTASVPLLVVTTAAVWLLLSLARRESAEDLPAYLLVGTLGVAMAYIDVREHRLPDWINIAALAGGALALLGAALATGEWAAYGRGWLAALAVGAFYFLMALIRPADLGLGDVKLSVVIGLMLGWASWSDVVTGVFAGFLLGGLLGLALLITRRAGRRTPLPFGPFMLAGALLALLLSGLTTS